MTRIQFLNDLYHHLYGMTREQAEQHLTYYAEMLADRMEDGMSEEAAVASMEDVETIARRILEEEGLPYTPPEERPPLPPEYPDASRLGGGGGAKGYQVPRKRNGRKILQIALWAIAAIAVVSAVSRWAWRHGGNTDYPTESIPIDISSREYDSYYEEAPYAEGFEYGGGTYDFTDHAIDCIDIQWASGIVYIQSWGGDDIQLQEYTNFELSERTRMSCQDDGGTLTIRYRNGVSLGSVKDSKWLTVLIPDGMIKELKIETASADIRLSGLETENLTASTASGYITPTECYTQAAELCSISGEVILDSLYADSLDVSTTSGGISGNITGRSIDVSTISGEVSSSVDSAEQVNVHTTSGDIWLSLDDSSVQFIGASTTSGDITLSLPYELGFTLDYSSISGNIMSFNSFSSEIVQQNNQYICNGGGCNIQVDTVSGDLEIY